MIHHPVFIHPDPQVLTRIQLESDGKAKVTPSLTEALDWVCDHEETISGIFISPQNSTYSTMRFLELSQTFRPAMPIFFIDEEPLPAKEKTEQLRNRIGVKRFFSDDTPFENLVAPLNNRFILRADLKRKKPRPDQQVLDYIPVPIIDLASADQTPFDLYRISNDGTMTLFASKNTPLNSSSFEALSAQSDYLYARKSEIDQRRQSTMEAHAGMIDNPDIPTSWKTAEIMARSNELMRSMRQNGPSEAMVSMTRSFISDLHHLIVNIQTENGAIKKLMMKSLKSDRSVFCASLSLLVCQQLKFEKKSTLEILGVASALQDISLFNTPFGDLTEKAFESLHEEEKKFHLRHPLLSADLIARMTDVPQVTLQVIRQQHEKRDRTGYPNRLGGAQIHPMAETLSLINSYYEVLRKHEENTPAAFAEMEHSVFKHYSESVVSSLRKIHSRL